jgi:RNA polymerase sporulation-specific sigma factor
VSISGWRSGDGAGERAVEELIHGHHHADDPADRLGAGERFEQMKDRLAEVLSELEVDVLILYVEGKSYQEIGDRLGRHVKSIDNALQRIKRKLELHLSDRAEADRAGDLALAG